MEQLSFEFKKSRPEPTKEKFSLGDQVRIRKLRPKTKIQLSYFNRSLDHRKGTVIALLGTKREPYQGVKVKFGKNGLEYAFYPDEVQKIRRRKRKAAKGS